MPRRGRFGRRPRASGNLTALVASLYREQRAAEDRAMFDAWENGGEYQGKPVTDGRIRAYIASRRNGFSKDDPLYDEWNNRLTQIDFKIGEDKITLAFQQGKVGAGAVAAYYRGQLSKIPKDSAFYRDVASRAAQWAKSAAGAARGSARGRMTRHLDDKQNGVAKTWGQYSQIEAIVTEAARRAGLIAGNMTLVDADATELQDLFARGIVGPKGTTITFSDWQHASVAAYKAFDTQIAINKQLNRGTKELTTQKGKFLNQNLVRINAIDDRAQYENAYELWQQEIADANGDPRAEMEASARYEATLTAIQGNAAKATGADRNDSEFIGGIQNEINALHGKFTGPSVTDLQSNTGEGVVTNDAEGTAEAMKMAFANADALATGKAFYGQTEFGGKFGVTAYPPGADLDPFGRNGLGPDSQPAIIKVNGKPTQVVLKGKPVTASGLTRADGTNVESVPDANGNLIPVANLSPAQIASLVAGGGYKVTDGETIGYVYQNGEKRSYGVITADGSIQFTDINPFGSGLGITESGFAVYTPTTIADDGSSKPFYAPPATVAGGEGAFVDPSINPNDLRSLAANAANEEAAAALAGVAEKRASNKAAEDDYMNRALGKERTEGETGLGKTFGAAEDFIRDALGVIKSENDKNTGVPALNVASKIPGLGSAIGKPPTITSPAAPPSAPKAPATKPPKPPAESNDDRHNPPPKPPKTPKAPVGDTAPAGVPVGGR